MGLMIASLPDGRLLVYVDFLVLRPKLTESRVRLASLAVASGVGNICLVDGVVSRPLGRL